jgi:hypothetical protein
MNANWSSFSIRRVFLSITIGAWAEMNIINRSR